MKRDIPDQPQPSKPHRWYGTLDDALPPRCGCGCGQRTARGGLPIITGHPKEQA